MGPGALVASKIDRICRVPNQFLASKIEFSRPKPFLASKIEFFTSQTNFWHQKSNFSRPSQVLAPKNELFAIKTNVWYTFGSWWRGNAAPEPNVYLNRPPPKWDKLFEISLGVGIRSILWTRSAWFSRCPKSIPYCDTMGNSTFHSIFIVVCM